MKLLLKWLAIVIMIVVASGCHRNDRAPRSASQARIKIVATTGMITDAVKNVGGEQVQVVALMGPGVDPHQYKASEGDVLRMAEADIIFYNGLHLEGKLTYVFERMHQRVRTVAVADGIDKDQLLSPPEFKGSYDPHIWFDVSLWMKVVEKIQSALQEFDPTHAHIYQTNARAYLDSLDQLRDYVWRKSALLPEAKRILITAHDAFNYFGRAYGFRFSGLQGISTASEAGTGDVQRLAQFIVDNRVPAIFVETSVPERYIEALREAVRARGFQVVIGGHLYSDALGNPGSPEGSYHGMMRYNIDTIVNALMTDL